MTSVVAEAMEKEKIYTRLSGDKWIDSLTVPYEGNNGRENQRGNSELSSSGETDADDLNTNRRYKRGQVWKLSFREES